MLLPPPPPPHGRPPTRVFNNQSPAPGTDLLTAFHPPPPPPLLPSKPPPRFQDRLFRARSPPSPLPRFQDRLFRARSPPSPPPRFQDRLFRARSPPSPPPRFQDRLFRARSPSSPSNPFEDDLFEYDPFGDPPSPSNPFEDHLFEVDIVAPLNCSICNREGDHLITTCPYMVLAAELEVFWKPRENLRYHYYYENSKIWVVRGQGDAIHNAIERWRTGAADDAKRLHDEGMNMVRITNLSEDLGEPKQLHKLLEEYGPMTNVIVFRDEAVGLVNFLRKEDAMSAIKSLNASGSCGHLKWAHVEPTLF